MPGAKVVNLPSGAERTGRVGRCTRVSRQPHLQIFTVRESLPAGSLSRLHSPVAQVLTRQEHRQRVDSMSWFVPREHADLLLGWMWGSPGED